MDEHLDELRRLRGELVARSERLRLWSRLAGARMDLLTAQVCPPATADEVADDELSELADLVLGAGPAAAGGEDRVGALLALRAARRDLARRREHLDDLVCWSTAELLLEGSWRAPARAPQDGPAAVPGQRSARRRTAPRGELRSDGRRRDDLRGPAPQGGTVVALAPPPGAGSAGSALGAGSAPAVAVADAASDVPVGAVAPAAAGAACHTPR